MSRRDPVTTAEAIAIYDDLVTRGRSPREAYQGARTEVHALLQLRRPAPYSSRPAHLEPVAGKRVFHRREAAAIHQHQRALVSDEHRREFEEALAAGHPDAALVVDAHHFAQKRHGMDLWARTDALLADAGVTEEGRR